MKHVKKKKNRQADAPTTHILLVDYIRCSSTSLFAPKKPLVSVADFTEYQEWVSAAVSEYLGLVVADFVTVRKGHYGYKSCLRIAAGIVLYVLPHDISMGVCLQLSGEGMETMRVCGWTDLEVVSKLHQSGVRFSRVDVAIDTYSGYVTRDLIAVYEKKQWEPSRAEKVLSMHDMVTNARTLYIGSRSSEAYIRVYDKSVKENEREGRTRLEIEYKQDLAKWAGETIAQCGISGVLWDVFDRVGKTGVSYFPSSESLDVQFIPPPTSTSTVQSKEQWVSRCIKAITEGILEMGVCTFCALVESSADFPVFDKIRG